MNWKRYQRKRTAYDLAVRNCHFEVAMLLLDRGAVVKKDNIVSDITREIVVIVCVSDCVIKLYDSSTFCMSSSLRQYNCDLSISQVCIIAHTIWAYEMR